MKSILAATILAAGTLLIGCGVPSYDKARYAELEQVILKSTNLLVGLTVGEATNLVHLDHVRCDSAQVPQMDDELQIFHFPGFFLELTLTHSLPTPKTNATTGLVVLNDTGNWWVAAPGPSLHIDRLNNPDARMSNYWDNVQAMSAGVRAIRRRSCDAIQSFHEMTHISWSDAGCCCSRHVRRISRASCGCGPGPLSA